MDDILIKCSKNLKILRQSTGLTGTQFGELLGVTKQTISGLERGTQVVSKSQLIAILSLFEQICKTQPQHSDSFNFTNGKIELLMPNTEKLLKTIFPEVYTKYNSIVEYELYKLKEKN